MVPPGPMAFYDLMRPTYVTIKSQESDKFKPYLVQCPHSKEEDSVATICGFEDEFQYLKV